MASYLLTATTTQGRTSPHWIKAPSQILIQQSAVRMDDPKILNEVLGTVKVQSVQLRRCLEQDQIMEALKAASSMLAELRTSSLSPKHYYELYMSVFDSLRHLSNYLFEAHTEGKHHLADLYELVQ